MIKLEYLTEVARKSGWESMRSCGTVRVDHPCSLGLEFHGPGTPLGIEFVGYCGGNTVRAFDWKVFKGISVEYNKFIHRQTKQPPIEPEIP